MSSFSSAIVAPRVGVPGLVVFHSVHGPPTGSNLALGTE
jgi:hypothetical protein